MGYDPDVSNVEQQLNISFAWDVAGNARTVDAAAMRQGQKVALKRKVPYVVVDGVEHSGEWAQTASIPIAPGAHHIEVYIREKVLFTTVKSGKLAADFTLPAGSAVSASAEWGFSSKLTVNVEGQEPSRSVSGYDRSWFPEKFGTVPWYVNQTWLIDVT
ncbi:MAG: hypothetical protein QOD58_2988 [Mycobacterium sp.]|nr:hypothetical protein [Mycobacterium sp.]